MYQLKVCCLLHSNFATDSGGEEVEILAHVIDNSLRLNLVCVQSLASLEGTALDVDLS